MKTAIRYYTRSGNTQKLAEAIGDALNEKALDISHDLDEKVDILFLGSSVYGGNPDPKVGEFIGKNAEKICKIVNFSTAARIYSTHKQIKKIAEKYSISVADEEFHCHGKFLILNRNRPNDEDKRNIAEFAKKIVLK